jgi:mitochondrial import receptor subunit TOM40
MAAVSHEKSPALGPYTVTSAPSKNSALLSAFTPLASAYSRFSSWRTGLGFSNPGTVENLQKEVKSEHFVIYHLLGADS